MTATYNDAAIIHDSSRLTYDGERSSLVGDGTPPEFALPGGAPSVSVGSPTPGTSLSANEPQIPEIR